MTESIHEIEQDPTHEVVSWRDGRRHEKVVGEAWVDHDGTVRIRLTALPLGADMIVRPSEGER